jgi:TonB family protein
LNDYFGEMKRYLGLLLMFILLCIKICAQPCWNFVQTEKGDSTSFSFVRNIEFQDQAGKRSLVLAGLTFGQSVALIIYSDSQKFCPARGDTIQFRFADGTILNAKNHFDSNCDQRSAIYFSDLTTDKIFSALINKDVFSIGVFHGNEVADGNLFSDMAPVLRTCLKCLSECVKSDSVATAIRAREKELVYQVVEVMPEYEGGYDAMFKFIKQNLHKPKRLMGTVTSEFWVDLDGKIIDPKIVRSLSAEADAEVLRVIQAMPRWKPGRQNGKPVRVKYVLPIKF